MLYVLVGVAFALLLAAVGAAVVAAYYIGKSNQSELERASIRAACIPCENPAD